MESDDHKSFSVTPVSFNEENEVESNDLSDNTVMTIIEPGLEIHNFISLNDPDELVQTKFISTKPNINDPNINADLVGEFTIYDHENTSPNNILINQIKDYASKINCSDFHGKGTIDDYSELFKAASKIANESKQIQLDVDIEGFNEFSQAAEDLSNLFENFTLRLQNINIINDHNFLNSVVNALEKIWKLSESFGRFKTTILATTTIQFPKTAHETAVILNNVMDEINCAMNYITHFVSPSNETLLDSELSAEEKNIISKAVDTIDNWNSVCEYGISIAMNNNDDLISIQRNNQSLKNSATILRNTTTNLRNKLNNYMLM
jgi:ubiquitin